MPIITVSHLKRIFRSYEKEAGVLAALKSLVRRKWTEVPAVDDISFSIDEGEIVGFVGPNGAGKTTTLKMLSGILTPTSGTCSVLGYTPSDRKRAFKKEIALVMGQKTQLIWDLPASDTFLLHRDLYGMDHRIWKGMRDTLVELLDVQRVQDRPVRQLSLGERMKCELIVALLHEPKVLFLDEPTIGLDAVSQHELWNFLRSYQKQSKVTVLLTSHYMKDIANLCPRVMVIKHGKLIYDGDYSRLVAMTEIERNILVKLRKDIPADEQKRLRSMTTGKPMERLDALTYRLNVSVERVPEVMESLFRSFPVEQVLTEEADLTKVMEKTYKLEKI